MSEKSSMDDPEPTEAEISVGKPNQAEEQRSAARKFPLVAAVLYGWLEPVKP